jgi:hypothetical protein
VRWLRGVFPPGPDGVLGRGGCTRACRLCGHRCGLAGGR